MSDAPRPTVPAANPAVKYDTYITYGANMELWEILMQMFTWVSREDAKRIAAECYKLPVPFPGFRRDRNYAMARYARQEALKLKNA